MPPPAPLRSRAFASLALSLALGACGDDRGGEVSAAGVPCDEVADCAGVFAELRACEVVVCSDAGRCALGPAADGSDCRDGHACTTADYCLGGACTGVALDCDDHDPCTRDECDDKSGCYEVPVSDVACDDDDPCTAGDTCRAGTCAAGEAVDGCCRFDGDCDDGDPCSDDRCAANTCAHPPNRAPCDDADPCTLADHCNGTDVGAAACAGAPLVCEDGNPCTDDACDPATGACFVVAAERGRRCEDGNACTVDACADGACVSGPSACECTTDDDCRALEDDNLCNGTLRCSGSVCELDPLTVVRCNPTGDTTCAAAVCDPGSGQCRPVASPDGLACDDQNPCTTADHCAAGLCQGTALTCDDGNPCTSDACSPVVGCVAIDNRQPCDDGSACTVEDTCAGGRCVGVARACDDDNPCTDDACDGGCVHKPNAAACDDGDPCTDSDVCAGGACVGDADGNCGPCSADADCAAFDDGDRCNGTLACVAGRCEIAAGTTVTCDTTHDTTCRRTRCEPATGLCVARAAADGTVCSDGSPCTSGDACAAGTCRGAAADCDDGDPCTSDLCDPALGCVHAARLGACDDGNACTTDDTCNAAGVCSGAARACNDGNACTVDRCDPLVGCTAVAADDGLPCDDATVCTSADHCEAGHCTGTALVCADANPCTSDYCSPTNGCFFTAAPPERLCDDGDPCTGGDHCSARVCVGAPLTCDDDDPCTDDFCDPVRGCDGTAHPDGEACEDGDPCTDGDTCDSGVCTGGAIVCVGCNATPCADPGPCTRATCDTDSGECLVSADNEGGACNDGSACTLSDHCTAGVCGGAARVCGDDDHNPCTAELCDPASGCVKQNVPTGTACPDADLCDGTETCLAGRCTVPGPALVCNDGNPCTRNACVPATGCSYPAVADGTTCADADLCDGSESCVAGVCGGGVAKDCDDDNACTNDACAAATGACSHAIVPNCGPVVACNGPLTTTSQLDGNVFPPVTLRATVSSAGAGGVTFAWRVISAPTGSSAQPSSPASATSLFQPDLVGAYEVELTATDAGGHTDACVTEVTAEPAEALRVELVWDTPYGDVDLHLASNVASLPNDWFDEGEDCFYGSCTGIDGLDWGPNGVDGDVRLDHDDRDGLGPEVIDIDVAPASGSYTVAVSYYCERNAFGPGSGPTTATVRVTCSGTTIEIGGIDLEETGLFTILGRISWPSCAWVAARSERYVGEIQSGSGTPQRCDIGCASDDDCLPGEECVAGDCALD